MLQIWLGTRSSFAWTACKISLHSSITTTACGWAEQTELHRLGAICQKRVGEHLRISRYILQVSPAFGQQLGGLLCGSVLATSDPTCVCSEKVCLVQWLPRLALSFHIRARSQAVSPRRHPCRQSVRLRTPNPPDLRASGAILVWWGRRRPSLRAMMRAGAGSRGGR